jgi:hypothetical protein
VTDASGRLMELSLKTWAAVRSIQLLAVSDATTHIWQISELGYVRVLSNARAI